MKFEKPYLEILLFDEVEVVDDSSKEAKDILGGKLSGKDHTVTVDINSVNPLN